MLNEQGGYLSIENGYSIIHDICQRISKYVESGSDFFGNEMIILFNSGRDIGSFNSNTFCFTPI